MLRFSPLMEIALTHLDDLDLYETMSDACAKALLVNVLDLIAADAEDDEQKVAEKKELVTSARRPDGLAKQIVKQRPFYMSFPSLIIL